MFCSNCGKENSNDSKFCTNCGVKLGQPIAVSIENNLTNESVNLQSKNTNKKKIPTLSWISLGFLGMQLFCFLCQFNGFLYKCVYSKLLFIFEFPYVIVSLILAIISRVKNKDKMSLVLIIVDTVVIVLAIIFIVLAVLLLVSVINACSDPNSQINETTNEFIEGCRTIG